MRKCLALTMAMVAILAACDGVDLVEPRTIGEPALFYGLTWLAEGTLLGALTTEDPRTGPSLRLHTISEEDGSWGPYEAELDGDATCDAMSFNSPMALSDGQVAYAVGCFGDFVGGETWWIQAVDPNGRNAVRIIDTNFGPTAFTFGAELNTGVVENSSGVCAGIAFISAGEIRPIDLTIDGLNLAEAWEPPGDSCTPVGRAALPAWSPIGSTLAFFGSPQSIGHDGLARLDIPWNLYLYDLAEGAAKRAGTNDASLIDIPWPCGLAWSPDGRWLSFSSAGESSSEWHGTWLVEVASGEHRRLTSTPLCDLAFAPDGQTLAGTAAADPPGNSRRRVALLDLAPLL